MANGDSVQKRLNKVRPPRVQMTYDVEIGDAMENKELPFVLGVVGDYGGNADKEHKRLKERKFVNVDNGNFDEVLAGVEPVARFQAPNCLTGDGDLAVELHFRSMADFRPEAIVRQVAPLARLLDARAKLADLRNKLAGNDKLDDILTDLLASTEQLAKIEPPDGEE
ncbi:type VI secretion system contractile sheath small subunit [Pseudoduganella plicata]|uniref:Type VI secretion system contractile sheath small subunit n=1 Tax=Pseudoduganella plicata TaxID=321984 RepID=A0A4P7BDG6_9BURK|nr:type VI secretion system contractile sheath small subunit [Pseudoduganella plicata]QBQ36102.1 type VI secretion system contractile sheath small subunit [Pseudoduganella plicata]GGY78086.1 type VI secretion system-associated protein [Pseudoduganella plicata]